MHADQIAQVRQFNRLVTQRVGALDDHFLGRGRPLGASRLLYEIGERGADLRALRCRLGLDAGYVSRLTTALAKEGLIRLAPGPGDRRVRTARLTARGRREIRELNARSDRLAARLLGAVSRTQRERLVAAMAEVHRLLRVAGLVIERVDPASPAARWCVAQYFAELDRRFPGGFDPAASLPAEDRDLVPPRGAFLVASIDGESVAGGCLKTTAPRVGSLKRMWVAASARGLGIGRRMLEALEDQARALGITTLRLETNKTLQEAIALYRSAGYRAVTPFNADPYATHWFEKRLGGTRKPRS
ncbi:MAG TPA: helix-turn-helix domain-containing GNAT family N-acetyltransferase [Gemmatimonadales bacterium]|jgi:DNA-binding MarR family transcriptional regulator/N-acetylglutamate synthase-like GNAT family acetyltransferase